MAEVDDGLVKRVEAARRRADMFKSALREAYFWLWPDRYYEMQDASSDSENSISTRYDHIFDPIGIEVLDDGAAAIAESIHPHDQEFAVYKPAENVVPAQQDNVKELADVFSRNCSALFKNSNFHSVAQASHKDFMLSTGFILIDRDPYKDGRIRFSPSPAYRWALDTDMSGRIIGRFRRCNPKARLLKMAFPGGKFSAETEKLINDDPEKTIEIDQCWITEDNGLVRYTAYETRTRSEVEAGQYQTSPVVVYRSSYSDRAWSTGPGIRSVPNVKVCNKIVELELQNAAIAVTGLWQAEDDGVLNARGIRFQPGAIIPKAVGSKGLEPLEVPGRFDISQLILENLHKQIKRAMYVRRVTDDHQMTATEYADRQSEMLREQRGIYGPLKHEFVLPTQQRVLDLAADMGLVQRTEVEQALEMELTGPLAQTSGDYDVDRAMAVVNDIATVMNAGPAVGAVNLQELIPFFVRQRNADALHFKNAQQIRELGDMITTMAAQMLAQQQMEGAQSAGQQQG